MALRREDPQIIWNFLSTDDNLIVCSGEARLSGSFTPLNETGRLKIQLSMASGIEYIPGSMVVSGGSELISVNENNLQKPVFTIDAPTATVEFTLQKNAGCEAYQFQIGGGTLIDTIQILTNSNVAVGNAQLSEGYNLRYSSLSINQVKVNPRTVSLGDTISRSLRILNGNFASRTSFWFAEIASPGKFEFFDFVLNPDQGGIPIPMDKFILSPSGDSLLLEIDQSIISQVGDRDDEFENGEFFTLGYKAKVLGCESNSMATSYPTVWWGCEDKICQVYQEIASVNITFQEPELTYQWVESYSGCFGYSYGPDTVYFEIENIGSGPAANVSTRLGLINGQLSGIDTSDVYIQLDGGAFEKVVVRGVGRVSDNFGCQELSPGNALHQQIDVNYASILQAGEKIRLRFLHYKCNPNECLKDSRRLRVNYRILSHLSYTDECGQNKLTIPRAVLGRELFNSPVHSVPKNYFENDEPQFVRINWTRFVVNKFPLDAESAYFELVVNLPQGVDLGGNEESIQWVKPSLDTVYNVSYVLTQENALIARWPYMDEDSIANFSGSYIQFPLVADCSEFEENPMLDYEVRFIPSATCGGSNALTLTCETTELYMACPGNILTGGIRLEDSHFERANVGYPDIDNNGCPDNDNACDGTGEVYEDSTRIAQPRLDRAVGGDTLISISQATLVAGTEGSSWEYLYFSHIFQDTSNLSLLGAELMYEDASEGTTYSCTSLLSEWVNDSTLFFDMGVAKLRKCLSLPSSLSSFDAGDNFEVNIRYRIDNDLNTLRLLAIEGETQFYASNVSLPSDEVDKLMLYPLGGRIITLEPNPYQCCGSNIQFRNCDERDDSRGYALQLDGYGTGNNFFPDEYRSLAIPIRLEYTVPYGYKYTSARIRMNRTAGNQRGKRTGYVPLYPDQQILQEDGTLALVFNLEEGPNSAIWVKNGGPAYYSDDAFSLEPDIFIRPTCAAPDIWTGRNDIKLFYRRPDGTVFNGQVSHTVSFQGANLEVSSPEADQIATAGDISWELSFKNRSTRSFAAYTWIKIQSDKGLLASDKLILKDQGGNELVPDELGLYRFDTLQTSESRTLRIETNYEGCAPDKLIITYGYDCDRYPFQLGTLDENCYEQVRLSVRPVPSQVTTQITPLELTPIQPGVVDGPLYGDTTINVCEPFPVEVKMLSAQPGGVYNLRAVLNNAIANRAPGLEFMSGSGYYIFPEGAAPRPFSDMANQSLSQQNDSSQFIIDLTEVAPEVFGEGDMHLPGIEVEEAERKVTLQFLVKPTCDIAIGDLFTVQGFATSDCGLPILGNGESVAGRRMKVAGITSEYATVVGTAGEINIGSSSEGEELSIYVKKFGTAALGENDYLTVTLPPQVDIGLGLDCLIGNCPDEATRELTTIGNRKVYSWQLPKWEDAEESRFGLRVIFNGTSCGPIGQATINTLTKVDVACKDDPSGFCPDGVALITGSTETEMTATFATLDLNGLGMGVEITPDSLGGGFTLFPRFQVINEGPSYPEDLKLEIYCVDKNATFSDGSAPVDTITIPGPIESGAIIDTLLTVRNAFCDPVYSDLLIMIPDTSFYADKLIQKFCGVYPGFSRKATSLGQNPGIKLEAEAIDSIIADIAWIQFEASWVENHAHLEWTTRSETDLLNYELERSIDTVTFTNIHTRDARGQVQGIPTSYKHDDMEAIYQQVEIIYYRVKVTDIEGRISYSRIRKLEVPEDHRILQFKIYPIPATDIVNVEYYWGVGTTNIRIVDLQGKLLYQEAFEEKSKHVIIPVNNWSPEVYAIEVRDEVMNVSKLIQINP
ncbi:MAG: T9SS type A sorting domain-containing protein [Bacteroidota bacterium]